MAPEKRTPSKSAAEEKPARSKEEAADTTTEVRTGAEAVAPSEVSSDVEQDRLKEPARADNSVGVTPGPGLPPTDAQLTGGRGDNLEETVQVERTGSSDPGDRNRMTAENATDLDALSASGPTAQGNRFGVSPTAASNFAREALGRAELHFSECMKAVEEAEHWADIEARSTGVYADDDEGKNAAQDRVETFKSQFEDKMDRLQQKFQKRQEARQSDRAEGEGRPTTTDSPVVESPLGAPA